MNAEEKEFKESLLMGLAPNVDKSGLISEIDETLNTMFEYAQLRGMLKQIKRINNEILDTMKDYD